MWQDSQYSVETVVYSGGAKVTWEHFILVSSWKGNEPSRDVVRVKPILLVYCVCEKQSRDHTNQTNKPLVTCWQLLSCLHAFCTFYN